MLRFAETHASRVLRLTRTFTRVAPLALALLLGIAVSPANAAIITDYFDLNHDYLAGVTGTAWDGLFQGTANVSVANANITNAGLLTLQSANGYWEGNGTGLLLYINVSGDFIATLHVAGADTGPYNDMGLMARVPSPVSGEDWVATRYFAASGINAWRSTNNDSTDNDNALGPIQPWIQLERWGDTFYFGRSNDGTGFEPIGQLDRPDMNGLTLQVGIWQATFDPSYSGAGQFDSFNLQTFPAETGVPEPATLCLVALGGAVLAFFRRRRAA
jgi:regulation of enolase protein 1 (concanavalin A-like superfamily)